MQKTAALLLCFALVSAFAAPVASQNEEGPIPPPEPDSQKSYALSKDVLVTTIDVVLEHKDAFIQIPSDINRDPSEMFEVLEDGKLQTISSFEPTEAPLTVVLVVEASPLLGYFLQRDNLDAANLFLRELRKGDWIALVAYDMRPRIVVNFTQNRYEIAGSLRALEIPGGFREVNMFDALAFTLDALKDVKGKKSIVIVGTGLNTFPRHTWNDMEKIIRKHRAVVYGIGMSWLLELYYDRLEAAGYRINIQRMNLLAARAQMEALAEKTGGWAYTPRFLAELPDIFDVIAKVLRYQHTISYHPTNGELDCKKRKVEIKLKKDFEEHIKRQLNVKGEITLHYKKEYSACRAE